MRAALDTIWRSWLAIGPRQSDLDKVEAAMIPAKVTHRTFWLLNAKNFGILALMSRVSLTPLLG